MPGCGSSLNASYDKKKGKYTGFSCWVYKNYGKQRCTSHAIGWQTLNRLVLEDIRRNAQVAKLAAARYVGVLLRAKLEKEKGETVRAERELKKAGKAYRRSWIRFWRNSMRTKPWEKSAKYGTRPWPLAMRRNRLPCRSG